jgi:uncharacterized OsmC-like protein
VGAGVGVVANFVGALEDVAADTSAMGASYVGPMSLVWLALCGTMAITATEIASNTQARAGEVRPATTAARPQPQV